MKATRVSLSPSGRGIAERALLPAILVAVLAGGAAAAPAEWTVLAYLSGDSSLEAAAIGYLHMLQATPAGDAVRIAVQIDRSPGYTTDEGNVVGAVRVVLASRRGAGRREAEGTGWHCAVDMGDPKVLEEFADWAVHACPAKRYLLLIMGHGNGVRALRLEEDEGHVPASGVAYDASSGGDCLTTSELGKACGRIAEMAGGPLGVLAVDACFSATAELACEVAPSVECLTGSPGLIYEPGVPWADVLGRLVQKPGMTAQEVGKLVVEVVRAEQERGGAPKGAYLAADLSRAGELEARVAKLVGVLGGRLNEVAPLITLGRSRARVSGLHSEMVDLSSFLRGLAEAAGEAGDGQVLELASSAASAADAMLLARFAGGDGGGAAEPGWVAFFPPSLTAFPSDYLDTGAFARRVGWGRLLSGYLGHMVELVTPAVEGARTAGT